MSTDAVVALATVAGVILTFLLGLLGFRATRRSTVDARAVADLEARDRLIDQLQEERNHAQTHAAELLRMHERDVAIKDNDLAAAQVRLREALDQIDMLTGQNRLLEEQVRQTKPPA